MASLPLVLSMVYLLGFMNLLLGDVHLMEHIIQEEGNRKKVEFVPRGIRSGRQSSTLGGPLDMLRSQMMLSESFLSIFYSIWGSPDRPIHLLVADAFKPAAHDGNRGHRECAAGRTFHITSEQQLQDVAAAGDEECLYSLGLAPLRPPVGILFGKPLKFLNSDEFLSHIQGLWSGKLAFKSQCSREDSAFYMVLNFVSNQLRIPALMHVGSLNDPVSDNDYDDGRDNLIIDYTFKMSTICSPDVTQRHNTNLGIVSNSFPTNTLVDVVRYVGKLKDGGNLMLGKTFVRNFLNFPGKGDRVAAFWYLVSYDDDAFPPLPEELGPIPETFFYHHQNVNEFFSDYLRFSDFLNTPLDNILQAVDIAVLAPMGLSPIRAAEEMRIPNLSGIPTRASSPRFSSVSGLSQGHEENVGRSVNDAEYEQQKRPEMEYYDSDGVAHQK